MATKSALYFSLGVMRLSFINDLRRHQVEEEGFATLTLNILFILLLSLHFQAKCCSKLTPAEYNQVKAFPAHCHFLMNDLRLLGHIMQVNFACCWVRVSHH